MKKITLNDGCATIVDNSAYHELSQYSWICDRHKYAFRSYKSDGKSVHEYLHRRLTNPKPRQPVDHINADGLDNQSSNLRLCTYRQNNHNSRKRKDNSSGHKGVYYFKKRQKWIAQIMPDTGKRIHIGCFDDIKEAAYAYDQFAVQLFGEFARTNLL